MRNALLHKRGTYARWCNSRTVLRFRFVALVKFGYMLENPCIPRYSSGVNDPGSDKPSDAENQQERLIKIGWVTGFVDGEGCFSINFKPRIEMIRILRDYTPNAGDFVGEDIVRSAWRHAG